MNRRQLLLDEQTYETLRCIANRRHASMSSVVREILHNHLTIPCGNQKSFSFIAAGASGYHDTSELHDEVIAEAHR